MPILFADDSNLFENNVDIHQIQYDINQELAEISTWLKVNKLSLNIKKTQYMVFSNKNVKIPDISLQIEGQSIARTRCSKFLGVYIDDQINWKHHIRYISNKVSKGIGVIIKARGLLSRASLIQLYYSFVYPYLNYCNHVWGSTYISNLRQLIVLQKKAVRIISHVSTREHTDPLFMQLNLLKLQDINKYVLGCFMFRYHKNETPEVFDNFFESNIDIHQYYTRQLAHLHVPKVRTEFGKRGLRFRGVYIWNAILNLNVDTNVSEFIFKRNYKRVLISGKLS